MKTPTVTDREPTSLFPRPPVALGVGESGPEPLSVLPQRDARYRQLLNWVAWLARQGSDQQRVIISPRFAHALAQVCLRQARLDRRTVP